MDDGLVGGFPVHFTVNPVLARCFLRNLSVQRDKDRFHSNVKIRTGPLDIKTSISFPHADIAEISSHEVLSKEPFSYALEFT
jgi:hypothetical protein